MHYRFARRMSCVRPSFLSELFRLSKDPDSISFAGGLPSADTIDVQGIAEAARQVLEEEGREALQYTTTDGYLPLRQYIAGRYRARLGIPAEPAEIQIVHGSQQCLDLMGKIFLDPGTHMGMERPGYLGAIDAFSLYEPRFHAVDLTEEGPDPGELAGAMEQYPLRFFYGVPNSQNPSGITYSQDSRKALAELLEGTDTLFFEDDAFGELFFDGKPRLPVKRYLPDQTVMSGSFSKIIAPGLRIGWLFAPGPILRVFNVAKQAADLHTNYLSQKILCRYLRYADHDARVRRIAERYGKSCRLMCEMMDDLFPPSITHTTPKGGMFLLLSLPEELSAKKVFEEGIRAKVAVLPGTPFYLDGDGDHAIRLNFSYTSEEQIKEGIARLSRVLWRL
jgi:2-aminoadipate transaminase